MVFAQFKSLYLWLLLFSLALRDSIGSAQHDSVTVTVDTEAIRWDKSFYDEAKYRSGRRMGALWKGEEKSRIQNTGNPKNSQNQELRLASNTKKDIKFRMKTEASGPKPVNYYSFPYNGRSIGSKESHSVSYRATDQFQKTKTENYIDAVAEVYNMMAKDYHTKAKSKPPINNQQPFDEEP
ncbi:hypothetical protein KFK09_006163 [Dendrobium nobile]|uniref:Uncharacterized protein n=1 Tax=Dendrobium nobile TaxID=94219 RepID=A0A8T3BSM9_DENNO|nr:hypothetical protein KFK09_006163 [Dendrobium nobile]